MVWVLILIVASDLAYGWRRWRGWRGGGDHTAMVVPELLHTWSLG